MNHTKTRKYYQYLFSNVLMKLINCPGFGNGDAVIRFQQFDLQIATNKLRMNAWWIIPISLFFSLHSSQKLFITRAKELNLSERTKWSLCPGVLRSFRIWWWEVVNVSIISSEWKESIDFNHQVCLGLNLNKNWKKFVQI